MNEEAQKLNDLIETVFANCVYYPKYSLMLNSKSGSIKFDKIESETSICLMCRKVLSNGPNKNYKVALCNHAYCLECSLRLPKTDPKHGLRAKNKNNRPHAAPLERIKHRQIKPPCVICFIRSSCSDYKRKIWELYVSLTDANNTNNFSLLHLYSIKDKKCSFCHTFNETSRIQVTSKQFFKLPFNSCIVCKSLLTTKCKKCSSHVLKSDLSICLCSAFSNDEDMCKIIECENKITRSTKNGKNNLLCHYHSTYENTLCQETTCLNEKQSVFFCSEHLVCVFCNEKIDCGKNFFAVACKKCIVNNISNTGALEIVYQVFKAWFEECSCCSTFSTKLIRCRNVVFNSVTTICVDCLFKCCCKCNKNILMSLLEFCVEEDSFLHYSRSNNSLCFFCFKMLQVEMKIISLPIDIKGLEKPPTIDEKNNEKFTVWYDTHKKLGINLNFYSDCCDYKEEEEEEYANIVFGGNNMPNLGDDDKPGDIKQYDGKPSDNMDNKPSDSIIKPAKKIDVNDEYLDNCILYYSIELEQILDP